jgi:hypothetical protein
VTSKLPGNQPAKKLNKLFRREERRRMSGLKKALLRKNKKKRGLAVDNDIKQNNSKTKQEKNPWAYVNSPEQIKAAYKKRRATCVTLVLASLSVVPQKIISLITYIVASETSGGSLSDTRSVNYLVFIGLGLALCFLQGILLLHHEILLGWLKTKDLGVLMEVHQKFQEGKEKKSDEQQEKEAKAKKKDKKKKQKKKHKTLLDEEKGEGEKEPEHPDDETKEEDENKLKPLPKQPEKGSCFCCAWVCCCVHHTDPLFDVVAIANDYVDKDNLRYKHLMYRTLFWVQLGLMALYQLLFTVSDAIIANTAGLK